MGCYKSYIAKITIDGPFKEPSILSLYKYKYLNFIRLNLTKQLLALEYYV